MECLRRLWEKVSIAIKSANIDEATTHKSAIEDNSRKLKILRESQGIEWSPRFFKMSAEGEWVPKIEYDTL